MTTPRGKLHFFPGCEPTPDALSAPTDRDPITEGVSGDVWVSGKSRRTFDYYAFGPRGLSSVRYRTPSGGVTVPREAWEAWCQRATLTVDAATAKQARADEVRDHHAAAFGFLDFVPLGEIGDHLDAIWTPTDDAKARRLTRYAMAPSETFRPGGRCVDPGEIQALPMGTYTFAWGVVTVRPVLIEGDYQRDGRQICAAWWVRDLLDVAVVIDGHRWSIGRIPATGFAHCGMHYLAEHLRGVAEKNAAILFALWCSAKSALQLDATAQTAILRTKGERTVQPVRVRGEAEPDPEPPRSA